jgi:hypothetical protein
MIEWKEKQGLVPGRRMGKSAPSTFNNRRDLLDFLKNMTKPEKYEKVSRSCFKELPGRPSRSRNGKSKRIAKIPLPDEVTKMKALVDFRPSCMTEMLLRLL